MRESTSSATSCWTRISRLAPLARTRSTALASAKVEAGHYLLLTLHREANVRAEPLARIAKAMNDIDEAIVFPGHPRTVEALAAKRIELGPPHPSAPACRLRRLLRACVPGAPRPHGLRRCTEGGLLVPDSVHHPPRRRRSGSRRSRRGGTASSATIRDLILAAVADAAAPADAPRRCTETARQSIRIADLLCTMGAQ